MATTLGPELARDASHLGAMDSMDASLMHRNGALADDSQSHGGPPPNPVFSFPARPDGPPSTPIAAPSPVAGRTRTRRPMSAIDVPGRLFPLSSDGPDIAGRASLPAFSFNPGASLSTDPASLLSPPTTPDFSRAIPSAHRPAGHGHRRGGSEFVGGRLRDGNSIAVMGTSPTRDEGGFAAPDFKPPPRRGHRRGVSSAISSNDIPLLTPPSAPFMTTKGNSAPNSPTNFDQPNLMSASFNARINPQSDVPTEPKDIPDSHEEKVEEPFTHTTPSKPPTRTRVGFSDTLEFIPRPLSLISTDTSSTMTARPMHSVSDSITSMISITEGCGSPVTLSRSPTREFDDSRPSTAGAILDRMSLAQGGPGPEIKPKRRNSIPALYHVVEVQNEMAPAASSPEKPKRWTFFGLEPFSHSHPSTKGRPRSSSSGESVTRAVSGSSSEHGSESPAENDMSVQKAKKTKRKKVKGWAGAILPIKSKSEKRSKHPVRPPTPPASIIPPDEDDEEEEPSGERVLPPTPSVTVTVTESATPPRPTLPRQFSSDEMSLSMIDLDAALGPFNTPLPHNPEWEAAQRAAGNNNRRRLHSAQGMKGFTGPGMHYHRRAESAPDLPPFEGGRASIHRFGSSSTMADVFEEDEEDDGTSEDEPSRKSSSQRSASLVCSDGETTPPAVPNDAPLAKLPAIAHRKNSALSERDQSSVHSLRLERSRTSLQDTLIAEGSPGVRFNTINVFQQSSSKSGSPRISPRNMPSYNELSPVDIGPPQSTHAGSVPISPYSMSQTSGFPSPRSPMSMDAQRISTAPSSINDENSFRSLLMGEPGPEVRLSTDYDIPSLTSSTSTMTRDSNLMPQMRMSQPTLREPRPLSAAFGRRRSSLASLSRLISSSHGERSKLSEEVILDGDAETKKAKSSKSKRLGRLVQFWKPTKPESTE
ncbi:hypothetical protein N3K66_001258 [Trichothecium roseum]|uniref:Uncharacterized protein n=1 Tax=Trichothecium roseum TaxID=47278 RepID=A0ACC0VEK4_9HYPO|nr:hypothetical protein N3K66_001258 [Trichothecium roseum]